MTHPISLDAGFEDLSRLQKSAALALRGARRNAFLARMERLDAQRQETRVTLYNAELGGNFDQKLFEFIDPRFLNPQAG